MITFEPNGYLQVGVAIQKIMEEIESIGIDVLDHDPHGASHSITVELSRGEGHREIYDAKMSDGSELCVERRTEGKDPCFRRLWVLASDRSPQHKSATLEVRDKADNARLWLRSQLSSGKIKSLAAAQTKAIQIPSSMWNGSNSLNSLILGVTSTPEYPMASFPFFIEEKSLSSTLMGDEKLDGAGDTSAGGRPAAAPAIHMAYDERYPNGHGSEGHTWDRVAIELEKLRPGTSFKTQTVRRAIHARDKV